jgi:hypothetical protein
MRLRKLGLPVVRWPGAYRPAPVVVAALRAGLFPFVASVGSVTDPAGAWRASYLLPGLLPLWTSVDDVTAPAGICRTDARRAGLFPTRLMSVDSAAETGGCMTCCDLACR